MTGVQTCALPIFEQPFTALISGPATADCPWLRLTMVILKCGHGIGIAPKQKDRPARLLLMNGLESYSVVLTALERSAMRFDLRREPQKDSCGSSARKMQFSLGWNRAGAQTPASISSSRLQDRNFTGTVYNCALYSKGCGTLRLSCRS